MDDLINRQDAIDAIERTGLSEDEKDTAIRVIENLPSAERKGRWIDYGYQSYTCVCSCCGIRQDIAAKFLFSYCPNCGAKMEV